MHPISLAPTATIHSAGRIATLLAGLAIVVVACGAGDPVVVPSESVVPGSPTSSPEAPRVTPSPEVATPAPTVPLPGSDGDRPDLAAVRIAIEPAFEDLDQPLFVTAAGDGSDRLFIAEQGGTIRVVRDGRLLATPYLDISDRVSAGGERGLLGVAFAPGFGDVRPIVYVHYSDSSGDTRISSFTAPSGDADAIDPATERLVLEVAQPYGNHNGGWIGFDADGMLLIGLGDGGAGGDPGNRASDLGTLLGKLLRIDVLGAVGAAPYRIPDDNPFVGRDDARGEILHYGLRNPFRASVDLETGNTWIGDVGQGAWEEVDVAPVDARGLDFGWRRWEGRHCYDTEAGCDKTGVTMPVTEYPHADGCSVIGGVVYRGDAIPALRGAYLFSDYCSGTLWAIDAGLDAPQAPIVLAETGRNLSSFGIDESGEVYLTDLAGEVLRLVAEP